LSNISYPGGATVTYLYDNDSNRISIVYGSTKILDSYDTRDRLTNETSVISGVSYSVLYSYDKASNIVKMTYPGGTNVSMSYDFLNRLIQLGSVANLTYTSTSQLGTVRYHNGANTTYSYNSQNEITRILSRSGSTKLLDLNYTYDGVGNVKSIDSENFTYNWLNQLSSAVGPWGTLNYTYDGVGNMLTMKQGNTTTTYSYGSYNRLSSAGSANFSYDANGNTIKELNGSTTWKYYYDYENRLTSVTKNAATVQNNTYNGDGKRVSQTVSNSTVVYVYNGLNVIYEKNLTSGQVTDLYYGAGEQLGESVSSSSYYFLSDELRSTRAVVNSSGSIVFSSDYKPFGLSLNPSGTESFLFTGQIYDSSTGLYYYNARFYNPSIQRFMTEDSSQGSAIQDRYVIVNDNPETLYDPTGLTSTKPSEWTYFLDTWLKVTANEIALLIAIIATGLAAIGLVGLRLTPTNGLGTALIAAAIANGLDVGALAADFHNEIGRAHV
jgi:RHS repeat-associated protein